MSLIHMLAMSSNKAGATGGANPLFSLLPILLVFGVFWFMIIRPQKKQQDQRKAMIESIKRGDKMITSGGLYATVKDVKADMVVATIAENVKVQVAKSAISVVMPGEE